MLLFHHKVIVAQLGIAPKTSILAPAIIQLHKQACQHKEEVGRTACEWHMWLLLLVALSLPVSQL